jgi:hypothetical protein
MPDKKDVLLKILSESTSCTAEMRNYYGSQLLPRSVQILLHKLEQIRLLAMQGLKE